MSAPCQGCQIRHTGCWSDCPKYAAYRKPIDAAQKQRAIESAADEIIIAGVHRVQRKAPHRAGMMGRCMCDG